MFLEKIFNKINSSKTHPYFYLSPNAYAIGNCAEEIFNGLIHAKDSGKKLFIIYTFNLPFIFKYKLTNRSLFSIQSSYIYQPNSVVLFFIRLLLTLLYIPLRLSSLISRRLLDVRFEESYDYPCVGKKTLFVPSFDRDKFEFMNVIKHDWKKKFNYTFDFTLGGCSKEEILSSLEAMGIPKNDWYVCLHVRESGFRNDKGRREYRNSDINNYIPAIKEIVSRGGWVVRMGDDTMKPLPKLKNVIDYPFTKFKSEILDLCLIKHCYFYIGCQSGIYDVAKLFKKPTLLINMINWTFGGPLYYKDRAILKHIYCKKYKKYLSLKELFTGGWETQNIHGIVEDYDYLENSEEEILNAVIEYSECMDNGSFLATDLQKLSADHIKQQAYSIFKNPRLLPSNLTSASSELLEKYRFASQVEGAEGYLSKNYLKNNWEYDSLNPNKDNL